MSTAQLLATPPAYPDRSTRMMLVGIVQVLIGCVCGLFALLMLAVSMLSPIANAAQGPAMNRQLLIQSLAFYVPLAVAFTWLGIGSIRARRWAWTLTVVFSWMWLIMGVAACFLLVFFMGPAMSSAMAQQGKMPPEAMIAMQIVVGTVMACIYILLPGSLLLLCHHESVRATCRWRDPKTPWTDRCPMPVLALSIMFGLSVASMSSVLAYGSVMPLFGFVLSGAAGAAVILSIAAAMAYLAWGSYRLQMAAWWGMLALVIAGALNLLITISRADLLEMYEKAGMPADQVEMMRKMGFVESMPRWGPWAALVGGAGWLAYLLYVRRYFVHGVDGKEPGGTVPEV